MIELPAFEYDAPPGHKTTHRVTITRPIASVFLVMSDTRGEQSRTTVQELGVNETWLFKYLTIHSFHTLGQHRLILGNLRPGEIVSITIANLNRRPVHIVGTLYGVHPAD